MTTLKLTEYESKTELPTIIRAYKRDTDHEKSAEEAVTKHQADLFTLAREIYFRGRRRKMYGSAAGII
jgi:hypothetical protein